MSIKEEELTREIIKIFYRVYNTLGYGFLESVYQNAMMIEFADANIDSTLERRIAVHYNGRVVGSYAADIVVADKVILELKAMEQLSSSHEAQLVNYLRATDIEVGLLFNFGKTPEFKRKYFSNVNKSLDSEKPKRDPLESLFINDPFKSA